jgi:hypothetical protein
MVNSAEFAAPILRLRAAADSVLPLFLLEVMAMTSKEDEVGD